MLEGFTHLIPHAAGHEIIRQGRRDLHLVRMTPDVVYDQLIGAGLRRRADVLAGAATPASARCTASATPSRTAGRSRSELEEHSHAGMAARYAAGAAGLPFGVLRGYVGTDLPAHVDHVQPITCPFTGEGLAAVPALNPDVTVIHAQRADRDGQRRRSGARSACRRRPCWPPAGRIVTVEEVVDELRTEARRASCCRRGW